MTEKEKLIEKISEEIWKYNIFDFIVEEIENSLVYINKYKLQNIYNNINEFIEDILKINQDYIDWFKKI